MISGGDDRLAFVIETEAHLDGIRAARSQVQGIGTDATVSAQRMSAASQGQAQSVAAIANMSAKSRTAFEGMDTAGKKATLSLMGVSAAEQKVVLGAVGVSKAVGDNSSVFAQAAKSMQTENAAVAQSFKAAHAAGMTWMQFLKANMAPAMAQFGGHAGAMKELGAQWRGLATQATGGAALSPGGIGLPPGGIVPKAAEEQLRRIPGSARTAANALSMLGNAAMYGTGSVNGMIIASGGLASGLASLSKSATIAAAASGIGAIVTVAALGAMALYRMGDAAEVSKNQLDNLKNFTAANVLTNLAGIRAARDAAIAEAEKAADAGWLTRFNKMMSANLGTKEGRAVAAGGGADFGAMDRANQLNEAASKIALEKLHTERLRVLALADQARYQERSNALEIRSARATEGSLDTFQRRRQEIITQAALEDQQIKKQFEYRNEAGVLIRTNTDAMNTLIGQHRTLTDIQLHELTQAEQLANAAYKRTVATAVAASGGSAAERYEAKLAEINAEADLDLKAGRDAVEVERRKQAAIRQLRRETAKQASEDAKTITAIMIDSGSKQVRAVGHAADTIRRVVIGAQAAHAAVEAAIEGGKAIGAAATGNWAGAALHGAASLELMKAAALGAQESLGGGRSAGGGGGSAGSGGGSTFEPRNSTEGQGSLVVNLYSQNPYGAEQIQQVKFELGRADILKRPGIQIQPTNGLRVA